MNSTSKHGSDRKTGELPRESMDAIINSIKKVVRECAGLEIRVERESRISPSTTNLPMMLVVTLPAGTTPEQQAEADYWINEIALLYRYADEPLEQ